MTQAARDQNRTTTLIGVDEATLTTPTLVGVSSSNELLVKVGAFTETNSAAIKTAVEIIDNAISGNEMQVDVLTMPTVAVTGTFWQTTQPISGSVTATLAASDGTDIGSVDILSVIPGTGATNLGKVEDAAHSTGDVGVMALAVENEDQADLSTGDKDYTPIAVTKEGNVIVKQEGTITVTESSPLSGFATSALQLADGHNVTVDNAAGAGVYVRPGTSAVFTVDLAGNNDVTVTSGNIGHDITGMIDGVTTVTTAGTDVVLAASTACKRVICQAQTDNTSIIAVGATGVDATEATGTGFVLYPGDGIEMDIDNLADIFIDSLVNGEGVRWVAFT